MTQPKATRTQTIRALKRAKKMFKTHRAFTSLKANVHYKKHRTIWTAIKLLSYGLYFELDN